MCETWYHNQGVSCKLSVYGSFLIRYVILPFINQSSLSSTRTLSKRFTVISYTNISYYNLVPSQMTKMNASLHCLRPTMAVTATRLGNNCTKRSRFFLDIYNICVKHCFTTKVYRVNFQYAVVFDPPCGRKNIHHYQHPYFPSLFAEELLLPVIYYHVFEFYVYRPMYSM